MTSINDKTTVKQLKALGVSIEQIQSLIASNERKANRSRVNAERDAFVEEVYTIMVEDLSQEWKNGLILKAFFPNGKSKDEEIEKARRAKHAEISRALQSLVDAGRIEKQNKTNTTAGTFYTVVKQLPMIIENDNQQIED